MNLYQQYTVASVLIIGAVIALPLLALFLTSWKRGARFRTLARASGLSYHSWRSDLTDWKCFPGGQHVFTGTTCGRRVAVAELPGSRSTFASATYVCFGAETPDVPALNACSRRVGIGALFNLDSGIRVPMDDPEIVLGDPVFDRAIRVSASEKVNSAFTPAARALLARRAASTSSFMLSTQEGEMICCFAGYLSGENIAWWLAVVRALGDLKN